MGKPTLEMTLEPERIILYSTLLHYPFQPCPPVNCLQLHVPEIPLPIRTATLETPCIHSDLIDEDALICRDDGMLPLLEFSLVVKVGSENCIEILPKQCEVIALLMQLPLG